MELQLIRDFGKIEDSIRNSKPELFYINPAGKECLAPIPIQDLKDILFSQVIFNPSLSFQEFIIKCVFGRNIFPDKNYDNLEVIKGKDHWVLYERQYDFTASIISVANAIKEINVYNKKTRSFNFPITDQRLRARVALALY